MQVFRSIFNIFSKKNTDDNLETTVYSQEKELYDYLYSNIVLDDFSQLAKDNVLNINYENYCYQELDFNSIMKVITNKTLTDVVKEAKILTLCCGAGQLPIMLKHCYKFEVVYGVETTFEFFNLSKKILEQYREYDMIGNTTATLTMNDPLLIDFSKFDVIFIEYNNTNILYNDMLKEKIRQECKPNTIVVKFTTRFKADEKIKLVDKISITNKNDNKNFVYFYKIKGSK